MYISLHPLFAPKSELLLRVTTHDENLTMDMILQLLDVLSVVSDGIVMVVTVVKSAKRTSYLYRDPRHF